MKTTSVLFVCLGNICRSPLAEGVFRDLVEQAGLAGRIGIDSAGTGDWHVGRAPDRRSQAVAAKYGIDISGLRARQICRADFDRFRFIIAMDRSNLADITAIAPRAHAAEVRLLLDYAGGAKGRHVPDPYYGGPEDFEETYCLVREGCEGLLDAVRAELAGVRADA